MAKSAAIFGYALILLYHFRKNYYNFSLFTLSLV